MTEDWKKSILYNQVAKNEKMSICLPITAPNNWELRKELRRIQQIPHDLVEWRADYFQDTMEPKWYREPLEMMNKMLPACPILATYPVKSHHEKAIVIGGMIQTGHVQIVDIPLEMDQEKRIELITAARSHGVGVVISHHNYLETPEQLEMLSLFMKMGQAGGDLVKLSVMANQNQDVTDLIEAAKAYKKLPGSLPMIAISMGELGRITRIEGKEFGSCITFGTAGNKTAPGQIEGMELYELINKKKSIIVDNLIDFPNKTAKK